MFPYYENVQRCFFHQPNQAQTREPFLFPKCPVDTMKKRHRFCPHGGAKRFFIFLCSRSLVKNHDILVWSGLVWGVGVVSGWRDVRTLKRLRQKELKQWTERNKRVPPPIPNHRASSRFLLNKEGSAICDWFPKLFSQRRVSLRQDSTGIMNECNSQTDAKGLHHQLACH